jgi:deoxyribodipyrimidine photolyase-related protein
MVCGTLTGMKRTIFLTSYQLHPDYLTSIQFNENEDTLLYVSSLDQWTYYTFHKQRLVYHLSSYRHHYEAMKTKGCFVVWKESTTLQEALKGIDNLHGFCPTNFYEKAWLETVSITLHPDPTFYITDIEWNNYLPANKPWKLDPLYRLFRQRFNILMNEGQPIGNQYSFDQENRQGYKGDYIVPRLQFLPDTMTQSTMKQVEDQFPNHPGKLQAFDYPVTRVDALLTLNHFVSYRLATFGIVQDAMVQNDPWMSHSLLSACLNLGLLSPREVVEAAQQAYHQGLAPLSATEGFIRQILGWREYIRGVYLRKGPSYLDSNYFHHHQPLPSYFYDAKTELNCLSTTFQETIDHGYNHHIQRLMVISNYANLTQLSPQEVNRWFNEMYIDSMEWIVAPNVLGMGLYADGGQMSTKPYISSGTYLHKMSNYCDTCSYQVTTKTGLKACPFNSLYWQFIHQKQDILVKNPRMSMMVNVWKKMDPELQSLYLETATQYGKNSR